MEDLRGYVEHIVYRNADNGYTVLDLVTEDGMELTCVGSFAFINEGEYATFSGNFINHAVYGRQFSAVSFTPSAPQDAEAMERYLGSGAIKGVGATMAKRIVKAFGDKTFEVIEKEPEKLVSIKGISERIAQNIYKQFEEKRDARDAMLYLGQFGLSQNLAIKIYKTYGNRMQQILSTNPYKIAEDIKGVGFRMADEIAKKAGFADNSEFRIRSGLIYAMNFATTSGHAYAPESSLYKWASELLGVDPEIFPRFVEELCMSRKLIVKVVGEERRVYLSQSYYTELNIARMLSDLNLHDDATEAHILSRLTAVEQDLSITLDEKQKEALEKALTNSLLILTGGPGTGKTTTINALIKLFHMEGLNILLAAPTGRAAKRMSEATGEEARTLHRLLEFQPMGDDMDDSTMHFQRNDENPLDADVIIVDEASMIDMNLMYAFLKAVLVGTRVIFAGDARQLPSVGPGNVLKDIIASQAFPVVKLTHIFRQATESDIIMNAHKINSGEHLTLDNKSKDFFMLRRDNISAIQQVVIQLVRDKMPKYVDAPVYDVQVLTPMRKGELGVENLNAVLQSYLNPKDETKVEKEQGNRIFRVGDKVMQIKNDYQLEWKSYNKYGIPYDGGLGVFNGDMGVIKEINNFAEIVTVVFDDVKEVDYPFSALDELEHAFAVTVHKSQGSEYPAVVIPLLGGPRQLLNRNLLYTAVTRASKCVTIVGSEATVEQMIDNEDENKRYTGLKEAIEDIRIMY